MWSELTSTAVLLLMCSTVASKDPTIFLSEVAEGSGYNKVVEIYNPGPDSQNLSTMMLGQTFNDAQNIERFITLERTGIYLNPGEVHVICHKQADGGIASYCDQSETTLLHNGNDAILLLVGTKKNYTIIDTFGDIATSNTYWSVCGIANATKDHVLIRKKEVVYGNTNWARSRGSNGNNCEWEVHKLNTFGLGGAHDCVLPPAAPTPSTTRAPSTSTVTPNVTTPSGLSKNDEDVDSNTVSAVLGVAITGVIIGLIGLLYKMRRRIPTGYFRNRPHAVINFGGNDDDDLISMASTFSAAQLSIEDDDDDDDAKV